MTKDVIALTERMPDPWALVVALMSGGPDTEVATGGEEAVIQLCDADGRPLVSIEAPMLVQTPGEAARLLGPEAAAVETPVWWTEVRAATAARHAEELAGTIATRLVTRLGGMVWPPEMAAPDGGSAPVPGVVGTARPAAAQPAVDVLTEKVAAVIQDRPVVAMTAWLSDALRAARDSERGLQIVTPRTARLSFPARVALSGLPNRWVVRDGEGGYYDGLSGSEVRWEDGTFAATGTLAPPYAQVSATGEHQLLLTFAVRHPADGGLLLGGALEAVWRLLTGSVPAGWGTAEPANLAWDRYELTDLARGRAPDPTLLIAVGAAGDPDCRAIATLRVGRTTGGVEEEVTLALGYPKDTEPPLHTLRDLAECLVTEHGLVSLLIQRRQARADLSVPAHLEGPPVPDAFVIGGAAVREIGQDQARRTPLPSAPVQLGRGRNAGLYYPLGDGGWEAFQQLMVHLYQEAKADGPELRGARERR